jgi:plasmid stabilization system protein ParE
MRNLRYDPVAYREYIEALDWYASKGGSVGAKFDAAFDRAIVAIRAMPELYGTVDGTHRWCPIKKSSYGVVYRVTPDEIVVVGVPHNRQRAADWGSRG